MGYALFCNRKLMLTSRLSDLQVELDSVARQKQNLLDYEAAIADGEVTVDERCSNVILSGHFDQIESIWVAKEGSNGMDGEWTDVMTREVGGAMTSYYDNNPQATEEEAAKAQQQYEEAARKALRQNYVKEVETKRLAAIENQLDQMQKKLETKISATQQELQSVEQAEAQAIQNATPKYAGVG
ncbi:hypothetical protein IJ182_08605 [bacterium]|nr:hypothetical protein [bacterium]